jgi:RNA-directed DNA polymerase
MSEEQNKIDDIEVRRSILEMTNEDARAFLLKEESYCNFLLPPYIKFDDLLHNISVFLTANDRSKFQAHKPRDEENLNHIIFNNKDGKYAWRPLQLIDPVLYVSLVHSITESTHWTYIIRKFQEFSSNSKIKCLSLPGESLTEESDRAEQVTSWWKEIEQESIELALEYEYITQTDITDCYGSIYTHSISWALHTKPEAKSNRNNNKFIGVQIDNYLQDMSYAQTNGIPQGSVVMDFIAEIVLGYADQELTTKINKLGITDYQILRYRDDYRIFINSLQDGEKILKALTQVLIDLSFKLNSSKTSSSNQVIQSSIKPDKLAWLMKVQDVENLQKHLLIIHNHSVHFPNSGSVLAALTNYHERLLKSEQSIQLLMPMISIAVDIAYQNPRTYPIISAILSKLISTLETSEEKKNIVSKTKKRFDQLPNTGYMQIWLQRISLPIESLISYEEPICQLVSGETAKIWNTSWISHELRELVNSEKIIDREQIESLQPIVPLEEVELFKWYDG